MGYLVACFYFLLVGGDLLLKPISSILLYWDCLIGYNVFVITMKNILSVSSPHPPSSVCLHLSVCRSCLSAFVHLSAAVYLSAPVCLSVCLHLSAYLPVPVSLPLCTPVCLSVHLSVCLSVCLPACLSADPGLWLHQVAGGESLLAHPALQSGLHHQGLHQT